MNSTPPGNNTGITIALSKGRILEETLPLLEAAGILPTEDPESSRKLILPTQDPDVRIVIVRATDVPTYVQYGAADLGVAGKDVLIEHGGQGLYQPLDLNIARCKMMVAVSEGFDYAAAVKPGSRLRVATKYVNIARDHFAAKGVHIDLIKLYGSMELAPLVGLAVLSLPPLLPLPAHGLWRSGHSKYRFRWNGGRWASTWRLVGHRF